MSQLRRLLLLGAFVALAFPGGAFAEIHTLVFTSAPITVQPYGVARGVQLAASPKVDGDIVGMSASLVDVVGNPVPDRDVMLHHVVFAKVGTDDATCPAISDYDNTAAIRAQRFWAEGEEHFSLALPDGYGYPNRATDPWGLLYMLMNHHSRVSTVQVRYTVRYAVGEELTAVKPIWLDVRNCRADPVFNVPGTGKPGTTYKQHADWVAP
jgi:hypothetical protein